MGEEKLYRKGFGLRKEVSGDLARDWASPLVERARREGGVLRWPGVTVRLAKEFGFCVGVERAIDYAYEARKRFPDRRLFLTGEIIHNPKVNRRLRDLGVEFLDGSYGSTLGWDDLRPEDVVLVPAFGLPVDQMERLRTIGCVLVDTTCGSVLNVWKNVERYARDGFTCLIHGKWNHEETRATASRALTHAGGRYLVVRDLCEAEVVARFIEEGGDPGEFLARFVRACSSGFDPRHDLGRIGMANQTTMLMSESLRIQERIRAALARRYGEEELPRRFRAFDTICSATEDRQQAVLRMIAEPLDLALVIGGFNSSNTGHLARLCSEKVPTWHVEGAWDLLDGERIRHKPVGAREPVVSEGWLPAGDLRVGMTAGASTPDRDVELVLRRLLELRGIDPETPPAG